MLFISVSGFTLLVSKKCSVQFSSSNKQMYAFKVLVSSFWVEQFENTIEKKILFNLLYHCGAHDNWKIFGEIYVYLPVHQSWQ